MKGVFLIVLFASFLSSTLVSSQTLIYVAPSSSCGSSCTGDIMTPYDNIFNALKKASIVQTAIIVLIGGSTTPHYLIEDLSSMAPWTPTGYPTLFSITSLYIKPLFCTDVPPLYATALQSQCISQLQQTTVYLKTTNFTINVLGAVIVQNIIFDAVEDIKNWNLPSTDLSDCLTSKKRCCTPGLSISTVHPTTVLCGWVSSNPVTWINPTTSIFQLTAGLLPSRTLTFIYTQINNFQTPYLRSFIEAGPQIFNISMGQSTMTNIFFNNGLITSSAPDSPTVASSPTNSSAINIVQCSLANYNIWSIQMQSSLRREGYLFYGSNTFLGTIQLSTSQFANTVSSLRNTCWSQTDGSYTRPMNNLFVTQPGSRSDLWSQYHYNRGTNDYISSLIYIKAIYGALSINNCAFQNIIGTSGSVLRVDNVVSSGTWFMIDNSVFNATFAYDSFANIMISKSSEPTFSAMLNCPTVEIINSKFFYTYGCPGAYGNILTLCYWDSQPSAKGPLSSYSLNTAQTTALAAAWSTTSMSYANLRLVGSVFANNLLAVSNSLASIGMYFVTLTNNVFQGNGGTTAEIARASLMNSFFSQLYPNVVLSLSSTTHFGQSTVLYFDRVVRLYSTNNKFKGNWGPWEGSLALATDITIKNWINVVYSMMFTLDYYVYNQGIPAVLGLMLSDSSLKNNKYMDPMISISVDVSGVEALLALPPPSSIILSNLLPSVPTTITFKGVVLSQNIMSFDYTSYTYNSAELIDIVSSVIPSNTRYQAGLIKLIWQSEAADNVINGFASDQTLLTKVALAFYGTVFQGNQLLSMGCLMTTASLLSFSQIIENIIYPAGEIPLSFLVGQTYVISPETKNQGFFCVGTLDFKGSATRLQLSMDNSVIKSNIGVVLNTFSNTQGSIYISTSVVTNNTCVSLSTIFGRAGTQITQVNTIFVNNYNALGNVYLYMTDKLINAGNSYLKNNGKYASLLYMETVTMVYESKAVVLWNSIDGSFTTTSNQTSAQAGIYFGRYSSILIFGGLLMFNNAYAGLIIGYELTTMLCYTQISNHNITGGSLVGSFYSLSDLIVNYTQILNNTLYGQKGAAASRSAFFVISTSEVEFSYVQIDNNLGQDNAILIYGNIVGGTISYTSITNCYVDSSANALIYMSFARVVMQYMTFDGVSGLFEVVGAVIYLLYASVKNMTSLYGNKFLVKLDSTSIQVVGLQFFGSETDATPSIPLFYGNPSRFYLLSCYFQNAATGSNTVMDLWNSDRFHIVGNTFEFTMDNAVQISKITNVGYLFIESCTFVNAGSILDASLTEYVVGIFNSVVITNSYLQNFVISTSPFVYIIQNTIVGNLIATPASFPASQMKITDSLPPSYFCLNAVISLYGTTGILDLETGVGGYSLDVYENYFVNNTAFQGGAIYLSAQSQLNANFTVIYSVFVLNRAMKQSLVDDVYGRGGVLYQTSIDKTHQSTVCNKSLFMNNTADVLGGAIYFFYNLPTIDASSTFTGNYAQRLNHIGSAPIRLTLYNSSTATNNVTYIPGTPLPTYPQTMEKYLWTDLSSGGVYHQTYTYALFDMFNQISYSDSSSLLEVLPVDFPIPTNSLFSSIVSMKASQGIYTVSDLTLTYKVENTETVYFTSSAINSKNVYPIPGMVVLDSVQVNMSFVGCVVGQYIIPGQLISVCKDCPVNFWDTTPFTTATFCTACDLVSTICRGGNDVGPRQGFWRMNELATMVIACPRPESCIGNVDEQGVALNPVGSCAEHYQGNLYYTCVYGYAKDSQGNCLNCSTNPTAYILFFLVIIVQAVLIGYGVRETMKGSEDYTGESNEIDSAILLRIFMNYSQIFSLLTAIPANWPNDIGGSLALGIKTSAVSDSLMTLDCFFNSNNVHLTTRTIFYKALLIALNPFAFIILGFLVWVIYFIYSKKKIWRSKDFVNKVVTTIVIICFDNQPTIIKNSFSMLQCVNLYREDEPQLYLVQDYDVKCWEGDHLKWTLALIVPCLILWVILLPALLIYILMKNRDALETERMAKKFSFIYNGYRSKTCYWEFTILFRKITLICVVVFASLHSAELQIYLFLVTILVSYVLHVKNEPYSSPILNTLEQMSLVSLIALNMCGLYFDIIINAPLLSKIAIIAGFVGAMFFLVRFGILFFKAQFIKLKQNKYVVKIFRLLGRTCCRCLATKRAERLFEKVSNFLMMISQKIGFTDNEPNNPPPKDEASSASPQKIFPEQLEDAKSPLELDMSHVSKYKRMLSRVTRGRKIPALDIPQLSDRSDMNLSSNRTILTSIVEADEVLGLENQTSKEIEMIKRNKKDEEVLKIKQEETRDDEGGIYRLDMNEKTVDEAN